jgi:lipopolysaccharide/colanic/teichoic acid biosynthesis glycosyltransferase
MDLTLEKPAARLFPARNGRDPRVRARARAISRARHAAMPLMPSLERRRLQCRLAMMIGDVLAIFFAFSVTGFVYLGAAGLLAMLQFAQMVFPVYLTVALYNRAYSMRALEHTAFSITRAQLALAVSSAIIVFIGFYAKSVLEVSRLAFSFSVLTGLISLAWMRLRMRGVVRWRCGASVVNHLVIDDGGPSVNIPGAYHVSAAAFGLAPDLDDPHTLDRIGMVMRNADRVIISTPPQRRIAWAIVLRGANVAGEVIDETVCQLGAHGARHVEGQGLLQVSAGPLGLQDRATKRLLDLLLAGGAVLLLAPLFCLVALAIKLEDGGPVFFVQKRVGRSNRFFDIYKFRSMSVNKVGRDGAQSASRTDSRVTKVGRILRSSSVDELPQLFNVLRGDMSLVGPRPHAIRSQAGDKLFWEIDQRYWERHALRPGLTGLAQVRGLRGATETESDLSGRLHSDLEYVSGWSLWRDIGILLATFRVLVHDRAF